MFFHSDQQLIIRFCNSVFERITHFQIERRCRYRCRYLYPSCPEEKSILLKRFYDFSPDAFSLIFRENEDRKQAALIIMIPVRADRPTSDDLVCITNNVKMSPFCTLQNIFRLRSQNNLFNIFHGVVLAVDFSERLYN